MGMPRVVCAGGCSPVPKQCRYGPAGAKVCLSCHRPDVLEPVTCGSCDKVRLCPYSGPKCRRCYNMELSGAPCAKCGAAGETSKLGRRSLCATCKRDAELAAGKYHADVGKVGLASLRTLCAQMLHPQAAARIELWLLPRGRCAYILIRILLWTRYGRFAGLLEGPPEGIVTCRSGGGGYVVDATRYAAHVRSLRSAGRWPPPPARVVCCCLGAGEVAAVQGKLPQPVGQQLHPFRTAQVGAEKEAVGVVVEQAAE